MGQWAATPQVIRYLPIHTTISWMSQLRIESIEECRDDFGRLISSYRHQWSGWHISNQRVSKHIEIAKLHLFSAILLPTTVIGHRLFENMQKQDKVTTECSNSWQKPLEIKNQYTIPLSPGHYDQVHLQLHSELHQMRPEHHSGGDPAQLKHTCSQKRIFIPRLKCMSWGTSLHDSSVQMVEECTMLKTDYNYDYY